MLKVKILFVIATTIIVQINCELKCGRDGEFISCSSNSDYNAFQYGITPNGPIVKRINLSNCNLASISMGSFGNLPNLEVLDISLNSVDTLNLGVLDGLHAVLLLNASYNNIDDIALGLFDQMPRLRDLDLSHNKLTHIRLGALDPLANLTSLHLQHNNIVGLPLGLFDKPNLITYLDLSYNVMETLSLGIFDALKQVTTINLEYSKFNNIPQGIFDKSIMLQKLYLAGNGISEIKNFLFKNLENLIFLDLSNNALIHLEENVFLSLKVLKMMNLSTNQLKDVTAATHLPQINTMDVSNNKLQSLPVFTTTTLRTLNISANRFTFLAPAWIPKKINELYLHKNPWQCACLDQLLTAFQKLGITYDVSLYIDGSQPECVISDTGRCVEYTSNIWGSIIPKAKK
ncbi:uncharacterized protein LOC143915656 [Arctopsyche grandis]|uniref:uncharacterized protein LOC143915656 n=1 Tax=Arctopsyche grandis TaxID=121162 RepID=UPI00406D8E60